MPLSSRKVYVSCIVNIYSTSKLNMNYDNLFTGIQYLAKSIIVKYYRLLRPYEALILCIVLGLFIIQE